MSAEYSVELNGGKYTVRHTNGSNFYALRYHEAWRDLTGDGLMLALVQRIEELESERIEADERAVPLAWLEAEPSASLESLQSEFGMFVHSMQFHVGKIKPANRPALNKLFPLFTHPPAQAAQVDKPPRFGGCCCGEPCTLGTVHRTDGPCFVYEQPAAAGRAGGEAVDALQDAIFQIAERLGEVRDPGMDDMSWHTQLIARAQYLANAQAVDVGGGETE